MADPLGGAGASRSERVLGYGGAVLLTALIVLGVWIQGTAWTWWQWAIAVALAFDVAGGAIANALNALKRAYYSPPDPVRDDKLLRAIKTRHYLFPALHLHPFLVAWLFEASLAYAVTLYLAPLAFAAFTDRGPVYLHRPASFLAVILVLLASLYAFDPPAGMEWFAVVFAMKLIQAHGVREEPYDRPG